MKILMTDGSSTSARQAITCLGSHHSIEILDPSPMCQCRFSRLVKRWHRCPPFSQEPKAYLDFLNDRLHQGSYDVLFPTHEHIYLLSRFRESIEAHAAMAVPDFGLIDRTMNKAHFATLLDELGMPQPSYAIARTKSELLAWNDFPCWTKLDFSTAGQGVRFACSSEELKTIADDHEKWGAFDGSRQIVIQSHVEGAKRGASGIFHHGDLVAYHCCQSRSIGVGGSANSKISVEDPAMIELMESFGTRLGWHGAICLEYVYTHDQKRSIFECNPRIGETVLAYESGVHLCQAWIDVAMGRATKQQFAGREGIKTHLGFLTLTAMALEGAGRWQLASELAKAIRSKGDYADSRDEITRWSDDWLSVLPYVSVAALLLARPSAAAGLVRKTVENYSLTAEGAQAIRTMAL